MDDYGINEAYFKAANKSEQIVVEKKKKEQEIKEAKEQDLNESGKGDAWMNQLAKATAANTKEGDKLCQMIEDWIVTFPRSWKGMTPFMKNMIHNIFEANEYIPMQATEKLRDMSIKF